MIESGVDMIIVSPKFSGIKWQIRIGDVAEQWERFVVLEPLSTTSYGFEKKKQLGIVQLAGKEGIEI